jgi:hypothetical protein
MGMNRRLKKTEKRLKSAKETGKKNESYIVRIEKKVEKLKES